MPTGTRLKDGFSTTITMSGATAASLWEVTIKPPGADGGGPNDTTTMRNTAWRTRQPKKLKTLTPMTGTAQYDPVFFNSNLGALLNINQSMFVTFPDSSKLTFYGWLDKFDPAEHREGEPPTVNFTIEPSNQDTSGAEVAPTYTAPP